MRRLGALDKFYLNVDQVLQTLMATYPHSHTDRQSPASTLDDVALNEKERKLSSGLMRVNHAGEVCAQALYHGQSLTARLPNVREKMQQAAKEEVEHLTWCQERLDELNSHTSFLNPLWYAGSFTIGVVAGAVGDKWSLGFVAETERQVVKHLEKHMDRLPQKDKKSHAVLKQMYVDEEKHRYMAMDAGAVQFPRPIKKIMTLVSKAMTKTAFWI